MIKRGQLSGLVALMLVLVFAFAGCSKKSGGNTGEATSKRVGSVTITSNGETVTPPGFRVFELKPDGSVEDLQAPTPEEISPDAPTLTYASDFEATVTGGQTYEAPTFFLFDSSFSAIYQSKGVDELEPGKHIVIMAVDWGENAVDFETYWYYFNLEKAE